jgi:uroporphyrinogen decarboxylase
VPHIVFTKGGAPWLEQIAAAGADTVGVDWTVSLGQARRRVGPGLALQGNFDPAALFANPGAIRAEVARLLADFGPAGGDDARNGHVFNLGHGISQHAAPESVAALVAAVHELSPPYHAEA